MPHYKRNTPVLEDKVTNRSRIKRTAESVIQARLLNEFISELNMAGDRIITLAPEIKRLEDAVKAQSKLLYMQIGLDIGMIWNEYYWGPQMASEIVEDSTLEYMVAELMKNSQKLERYIVEFNRAYNEYKLAAKALNWYLKNADYIDFGDGIVLEKLEESPEEPKAELLGVLGVAAIHKNNKAAKGRYVLYEIKIDGIVYKYGVGDANRVTRANIPVRLSQQINKLRRIFAAEGIVVAYRIKEVIQGTKAEILENETYKVFRMAERSGAPIGNVLHIKRYMLRVNGMTPRTIRILKTLFKIKL